MRTVATARVTAAVRALGITQRQKRVITRLPQSQQQLKDVRVVGKHLHTHVCACVVRVWVRGCACVCMCVHVCMCEYWLTVVV